MCTDIKYICYVQSSVHSVPAFYSHESHLTVLTLTRVCECDT